MVHFLEHTHTQFPVYQGFDSMPIKIEKFLKFHLLFNEICIRNFHEQNMIDNSKSDPEKSVQEVTSVW